VIGETFKDWDGESVFEVTEKLSREYGACCDSAGADDGPARGEPNDAGGAGETDRPFPKDFDLARERALFVASRIKGEA
jgi:hypothetical protein